MSTPTAGVTAVPASAKAPQPDTPAPQVGGDDPSARLVAVKVVNAPLFGVVDPMAPGTAHGTTEEFNSPLDSCGMSLPLAPKAMLLVAVVALPAITTCPEVNPESGDVTVGQFVPVARHTAVPPIVELAPSAAMPVVDIVVKAPVLAVPLPIAPGLAHGMTLETSRPPDN